MWLLFNYKPWFKREGLPNHWQSLFKKLWVLHSNIHAWCPFSFPQCATLDTLERLLWWVLGHEKFCFHPVLLLKICPLLWATLLLCIVAVCWWKNEAYTDWHYSILLLSVIINSVTFVTDDFIFAKMERITKLLDMKERIPVKITITIREKQWWAGVLGPFLALQQFLPILVTLAQFEAFCHICY